MHKLQAKGSAAPLALLFTVVSMYFTTAYLKTLLVSLLWRSIDIQNGKHFMLRRQD
ncbi:MAG: hypothetical protein CM15mP64_6580 [Candidatus Neomarinimicrobiota bacterium]|nr:MAG: hypothetical protein CM15mP64_6580 [Candidatus Neomarinimicrobiota bacterium]